MSKIVADHEPTRWLPSALLVALMLALGACNTIAGAGEDVEATGEGVSDAAEATEEEIEE